MKEEKKKEKYIDRKKSKLKKRKEREIYVKN